MRKLDPNSAPTISKQFTAAHLDHEILGRLLTKPAFMALLMVGMAAVYPQTVAAERSTTGTTGRHTEREAAEHVSTVMRPTQPVAKVVNPGGSILGGSAGGGALGTAGSRAGSGIRRGSMPAPR